MHAARMRFRCASLGTIMWSRHSRRILPLDEVNHLREKPRPGLFHGPATVSSVGTFPQATLDPFHFHALPKSSVFVLSETGSARSGSFYVRIQAGRCLLRWIILLDILGNHAILFSLH